MLTPQVQKKLFSPVSGKQAAGAAPAPDHNRGSYVESLYSLCSVSELLKATPGNAGLDLSSTTATILTPDMPVTLTPMGVAGPLPEGIVGLVLGRSSLSFQGILVVRGAVDSDYTVEIKVLVLLPTKTVQINEGQRIAQFLFLLSFTTFFLMGERYIISDGNAFI